MKDIIIAAPFGNYVRHPHCTPTLGTFTLKHRGGMPLRLWRMLLTLRPCLGGWVNRLGLPCPALEDALCDLAFYGDEIVSIKGFNRYEWEALLLCLYSRFHPTYPHVELNFSCPNVNAVEVSECVFASRFAIEQANPWQRQVIAKLPPINTLRWVRRLYEVGIRYFTLCNTLPTPRGGLSGPVLKTVVLPIVADVRREFDDVVIHACGGIYSPQDAEDYLNAGADRVVIASGIMNPLRYKRNRRLLDGACSTVVRIKKGGK